MKKLNIFIAILLVFFMSITSQQVKAQGASVSFQFFYDNLSPYGTWVSYPQYGYVWMPRTGRGFHPYRTSGHWIWSDEYQWVWVSDYEWGWAPFHYGRWHFDPYYGWLWIPDYEWAPAWVVWRGGGDYYGWAPLDAGISIGVAFGNYSPAYDYWSFVPRQYITSPVIYNYYVSPQQNTTIIRNTTVINNYSTSGGPTRNTFVAGPRRAEVEQYTHQSIRPVKLSESSRPGRTKTVNNELAIYKPKVNAADKSSARPSKAVPVEKLNKINGGKVNEPAKTQPVRNEPQKNQPVRNEPQKNQPVRTESQKNQPVRSEPKKNQPVRTELQKNQPVRNEPQKNRPVRIEPQKNQPVRNEPQKNQPVRNEPQKNQPAKNQPQKQKND